MVNSIQCLYRGKAHVPLNLPSTPPPPSLSQGMLAQAVSWDVLEEQLFRSKIGYDKDRWKVFCEMLELHKEKKLSNKNVPSMFDSESFHHGHSEVVEDTLSKNRQKLRKKRKEKSLHEDTVSMLQAVLDTATHLSTFSRPLAPELAVFLAAKEDLYIPRQNITDVRSSWPGREKVRRELKLLPES